MANFSSSSDFDKRFTTIYSIGPDANGPTPAITVNLDDTVEKLLSGRSTLFSPCLLDTGTEELRRLNDGDILVLVHVWKDILEEVMTGTEIGVEDGKESSFGAREGISQVASFLEVGFVVAGDVIEPITLGKALHAIQTTIVEHPNLEIGIIKLLYVLVSVFEDLKGLVATREVDIDER